MKDLDWSDVVADGERMRSEIAEAEYARTGFVADAIKEWILREDMNELDIKVEDGEFLGRETTGHFVLWESGDDWAISAAQPDSSIASHVRFMGCWLEPVNGSILAVYVR
jgi:hypothetical protein